MNNKNTAYMLSIEDMPDGFYQEALSVLSSSRKEYVESFANPLYRAQALCGTLLLRMALVEAGLSKELLTYDYTGKPVLESGNFYLASSHSGTRVLCAISCDPVGIDIQKKQGADPLIVRHYLHQDEQAYLLSLSESERTDMFYALWCRKESYIKAEGCSEPAVYCSLTPPPGHIYYDFIFPEYNAAIYGSIPNCPYQIRKVSFPELQA